MKYWISPFTHSIHIELEFSNLLQVDKQLIFSKLCEEAGLLKAAAQNPEVDQALKTAFQHLGAKK